MARELVTSVEIDAPPEVVWQIMTDFNRFAQWNPFIRFASGKATQGSQLQVQMRSPNGRGMTFHPVILVAEPGRELRWLGRFLLPGVFDGEHRFYIESLSKERVRFVQSESFSGLLVPFFWRSLNTQTRQGFEEMNSALKLQAEHYSLVG